MNEFRFLIKEGKDLNDRDLQWFEKMTDGNQLVVPLTKDDGELKELLDQLKENKDNAELASKCLDIFTYHPALSHLVVDLGEYLKRDQYATDDMPLIWVSPSERTNMFVISPDGDNVKVAWFVAGICTYIAKQMKAYKKQSKIRLTERTAITDIKIEPTMFNGVRWLVIKPTIEAV